MRTIVRSELLKIRTTNTWWLLGLGALVALALAFALNAVLTHYALNPEVFVPPGATPAEDAQIRQDIAAARDEARSPAGLATIAADLYTSGQFFGLLLVMLLGALVVTNEFHHRTAPSTLLVTPRRGRVLAGKLVAAVAVAAGFWLLSTAVNVVAGVIFLDTEGVANSLGRWDVSRAVLLNLAAYALWALLGVGLGTVLRSQVATVVTGTVAYLLSMPAALAALAVIRNYLIKHDWVYDTAVLVPGVATDVMVTTGPSYDGAPQWWVGAVVLVGYGVLAAALGRYLFGRRDIA